MSSCRGIYNCSLCRQAKGSAPTGPLYRTILSMGIKSVAHYLIQTRRLRLKLETQTHSIPLLVYQRRDRSPLRIIWIARSTLMTGRVSVGHLSIKRSLSFISDDNNTVAEEEALDDQIGTEEHREDRRIVVADRSVSKDSEQVKKWGSCSELNLHSIGERLRLRKYSLCLLSDDNNAKIERASDNQRGNKEQNEGHHIVVAAINVAANSLKQSSKHGACMEPNREDCG